MINFSTWPNKEKKTKWNIWLAPSIVLLTNICYRYSGIRKMKITRRSWSWIHCQWKRISFHLIRHDDSMSHLSFMRLMRNVFVIIVVVFSYSPNERKMSHSVSYSRSINKHQQKKVIRPSIVAYRSKRIFSSLISTNVLRMITFFLRFLSDLRSLWKTFENLM